MDHTGGSDEMARRDGKEEHEDSGRGQCLRCTCGMNFPEELAEETVLEGRSCA